jgi:hypothetical protein
VSRAKSSGFERGWRGRSPSRVRASLTADRA